MVQRLLVLRLHRQRHIIVNIYITHGSAQALVLQQEGAFQGLIVDVL